MLIETWFNAESMVSATFNQSNMQPAKFKIFYFKDILRNDLECFRGIARDADAVKEFSTLRELRRTKIEEAVLWASTFGASPERFVLVCRFSCITFQLVEIETGLNRISAGLCLL